MCVHKAADGVCLRFTDESAISYCVEGPCPHDALSNADRIRSMSDEALADAIYQIDLSESIPFCRSRPECSAIMDDDGLIPDDMCKQCLLDWLREPIEEVDR